MTFKQAFAQARKAGKKTFSFNGRTYHPREGVYNTDNTYWRGLSGEGRRYSSALSNTYNNGQGFTVGYRKGGRVKKFKFV